jgi:hypothetical protein
MRAKMRSDPPTTARPAPPAAADPAVATTDQPVEPTVRVTGTEGQGVTVREKPGLAGRKLAVAPEGSRLLVVGDDAEADGRKWRNVKTAAGITGWVAAQYVKAE